MVNSSHLNRVHRFRRKEPMVPRTVASEHHQRSWTYHCHPNCLHSYPSIWPRNQVRMVRNLYGGGTSANIEMVLRKHGVSHQLGIVDHRFGVHPRWQSSDFWTINSITNLNFGTWFRPAKCTAQIWTPKKIWNDDTGWWLTRSWFHGICVISCYFIFILFTKWNLKSLVRMDLGSCSFPIRHSTRAYPKIWRFSHIFQQQHWLVSLQDSTIAFPPLWRAGYFVSTKNMANKQLVKCGYGNRTVFVLCKTSPLSPFEHLATSNGGKIRW